MFEIQDWMNNTSPWISIVEKGGGYWIKVDPLWVTHRDDGENIFTVSLSDGYSTDPPNLYSISYTIHYEQYDYVGNESQLKLARPEIEILSGPLNVPFDSLKSQSSLTL